MSRPADLTPPVARRIPKTLETHGHVRSDDYYWLRDREDPEVIAYLKAENAYTEGMTADIKPFVDDLFVEMRSRIKETDMSVPYKKDDYEYYTRFEEGKEYPIFCRKPLEGELKEQVMLDVNELAEGHAFMSIGSLSISSNQNLLAFSFDTTGRRTYQLKIKDLSSGDLLPDAFDRSISSIAWANDNATLFYTAKDETTLRPDKIFKHRLGSTQDTDELVFEEKDETFVTGVFKSKSRRFLFIGSYATLSSEVRFTPADEPDRPFAVIHERTRDLEYSVDHFEDHFYIRHNRDAKNFQLSRTPVSAFEIENWEHVIPHRGDVLIEDFEIFRNFLAVEERNQGLVGIRVMPWDESDDHYIEFDDTAYLAYIGQNPEFDSNVLRFGYTSMTTPSSVFDYDMGTREKVLLKQQEVLGTFDPAEYASERIHVEARDGVQVPVSLVYKTNTPLDGTAPLLLYAYGSYGHSMDATFSSARLSLLNRGFVFAIAHVRGGEDLGRAWYEDGKLLKKKNTFRDFVDCGKALVAGRYAAPDQLYAMGGSAGGLLMGAVINMEPEMWAGVVAAVPFVDVITTMLDESIPLTTGEYDEWGNPNDKTYYDYILSYSPYDQLKAVDYPNLLVTTGLTDSQVQYWEPAKWVARMRTMTSGSNQLLLKTNMDAGHGGASGRFERLKETAFEYGFLLSLADRAR